MECEVIFYGVFQLQLSDGFYYILFIQNSCDLALLKFPFSSMKGFFDDDMSFVEMNAWESSFIYYYRDEKYFCGCFFLSYTRVKNSFDNVKRKAQALQSFHLHFTESRQRKNFILFHWIWRIFHHYKGMLFFIWLHHSKSNCNDSSYFSLFLNLIALPLSNEVWLDWIIQNE